MRLQPLDLFFTRSPSWLSRAIRWAEREPGEEKSLTSHVGVIVTHGDLPQVECIEALRKVRRHRLWKKYGRSRTELVVYRPMNIKPLHQSLILNGIKRRVGQKYGYGKIGLHLLAKLTGRREWKRLSFLDRFPICSYLVAMEFGRWGYHFGVSDRKADPDDILDFCQGHPDKWTKVRPWGTLG